MKKISILLFAANIAFAQNTTPISSPKIKIILMGTFHFGATSDRNSTNFPDLFSQKRQAEIEILTQKLSNTGVNKIMVERAAEKQAGLNTQFEQYKMGKMTDTVALRNEIMQVAFRLAAKTNAQLVATDHPQELPYDKIQEYEETHKADTLNPHPFFETEYPFKLKRKKLKESTMSEYYIQLNNEYSRQAIMYDYLHYALAYGEGDDFVGESLTLSWYDRNLKIFTNILRNIDLKTDKTILVLYGAAHTAVLRQFFENHPLFEIVEMETVLI